MGHGGLVELTVQGATFYHSRDDVAAGTRGQLVTLYPVREHRVNRK